MTDNSNDNSDFKKINNFNFDGNIFNTESTTGKKKKNKLKKKKGMDFMEYAKNKGIEINLQYEEPKQLEIPKQQNYFKKDFEKPKYDNEQRKISTFDKTKEKGKKDKEKKTEKDDILEDKKDNDFQEEFFNEKKNKKENNDDNSYGNQNDNYNNNNNKKFFNNHKDYNYDYYNYNDNYNKKRNYYDNNHDNDYKNSNNYHKNNYYNNIYGFDSKNKNYNNNFENKKNNIAIELPDPIQNESNKNQNGNNFDINNKNINDNINQSKNINNQNSFQQNKYIQMPINPKTMIPLGNNKFDKSNPKLMYPNPFLNPQFMNNYHNQLLNMNLYSNTQLNINPYVSNYTFPIRDEDILSLVENYFSKKYLNNNLELRLKMLNNEGLVPIEFILELNKLKGINITSEKLCNIIEKIGSDQVGKKEIDNRIFLYPKNYLIFKDSLLSIDEMKKKKDELIKNQQQFLAQQQMLFQQSQLHIPFMPSMIPPMNMGMYYTTPFIWQQQMPFNIQQMKKDEKE